MLRDYIKSLTFVAVLLLGYTGMVLFNNKGGDYRANARPEPRLETARAAFSIQSQTMPASSIVPTVQSSDLND